jgi:hypothetical protein
MIGFNENNKERLLQGQLKNAIKKQRPDEPSHNLLITNLRQKRCSLCFEENKNYFYKDMEG